MCSRFRKSPGKKAKLIFAMAYIAAAAAVALAKPAFMDRYNNDPYSKAELRGKCTICHIGKGGAERNEFGEAFEDGGYRITPKLRAKFPELFEATPRRDTDPKRGG
jgi:hypothetical protein